MEGLQFLLLQLLILGFFAFVFVAMMVAARLCMRTFFPKVDEKIDLSFEHRSASGEDEG